MKGQGSVEFMAIVAAMLVVSAAFTHSQMLGPAESLARDTEGLSKARIACDKIAGSVDTVFKNGETSRASVFVEFSEVENLVITEDNIQMSILYDEEKIWVESSIEYGFENSINTIYNESYTAIVEWNTSENECIRIDQDDKKIFINIRPGE